jgi:hypothetical protein
MNGRGHSEGLHLTMHVVCGVFRVLIAEVALFVVTLPLSFVNF